MNKAENLFMNIWVKLTAILFLRQHENIKTYKTEQETFLPSTWLRVKVCNVMCVTT